SIQLCCRNSQALIVRTIASTNWFSPRKRSATRGGEFAFFQRTISLSAGGLAISFYSPLDSGARIGKIVAVHRGSHRQARIERQKPRLGDRWQLRRVLHIEKNVAGPFAIIFRE